MRIDMLDIGTMLVTMEHEEAQRCGLDFSADSGTLKRSLRDLLLRVNREYGLSGRGRSYLIEAFPSQKGCLLVISAHTVEHKRRVYRIKRQGAYLACLFADTDALLDLLGSAHTPAGYELYLLRGSYVLAAPESGADTAVLSEYGTLLRMNAVSLMRLREYGTRLDYPRKSCKDAI